MALVEDEHPIEAVGHTYSSASSVALYCLELDRDHFLGRQLVGRMAPDNAITLTGSYQQQ